MTPSRESDWIEQGARKIASPKVPAALGLAGLALFLLWLSERGRD